MRARSSAASVCSVRSRRDHPTSHPRANITGTEIMSSVVELGPLRTTVSELASAITSPRRESEALRTVPSSTAAPIPATRMPAPLTISCASTKERAAHTTQVEAGAAKGKRLRASRTSTEDVIPTSPSTNSGPSGCSRSSRSRVPAAVTTAVATTRRSRPCLARKARARLTSSTYDDPEPGCVHK